MNYTYINKTKACHFTPGLMVMVLLFLGQSLFAQFGLDDFPVMNKRLDQIESQKIAFLTNQLKLTTAEAQQFWPVYNEFEENKKAVMKDYSKDTPEKIDFMYLSDNQALQIADARLELARKLLDLQIDFHTKIKEVLPPKKVLMYYEANKEFKRILIKKLGR